MASSPDSQPNGPPSPTPAKSPPGKNSTAAPPPSNDSPPPPPPPSSPPPASSPPPPSPPKSPPPSPPKSPPPSPPSNSTSPPPPSKSPSPPPPSKSPSPPPPSKSPSPPSTPPKSPPPSSPSPSPKGSAPAKGSPPAASPPPPPPPRSPTSSSPEDSPDTSPSPPPPSVFAPPPPVNSSSPPRPPTSTNIREPSTDSSPTTSTPFREPSTDSSPTTSKHIREPTTDSSPPTRLAPRPPSKSGSRGSSVSENPVPNSPPDNGQSGKTGIVIGVVAGVVVLGFVVAFLFLRRRRKKHIRYNSVYMMPPYGSSPASGIKPNDNGGGDYVDLSSHNAGIGHSKTWFSYEELSAASGGFATENILGRGGFGCVYKGCLHDGREVAIKKLKDNSGQGDREFKAEVEIISRVHHRHLVSLVGYCITDFQRLLVYEFVPNGTLEYHLHNFSKPAMQWNLRVKVACGSARGITYLHEDCSPRIIHRDIKSANILVDNNFEAKVADFGLAKIAQELESNTHVSTRVMGTFGYMAPEYASSGKLNEKSDVFSFGVVLLEVITGRKPVDETRPLGDESLVEWARPLMTEALDNENFDELADPRLQGNYDRGEMFRMIEAAAACVRHSAVKRPKMSQVVRALDSMNELSDISNGMKPGESGIFDSREQSFQIKMFQRMAFGSQDLSGEQHQEISQTSWPSSGTSGLAESSGGQV